MGNQFSFRDAPVSRPPMYDQNGCPLTPSGRRGGGGGNGAGAGGLTPREHPQSCRDGKPQAVHYAKVMMIPTNDAGMTLIQTVRTASQCSGAPSAVDSRSCSASTDHLTSVSRSTSAASTTVDSSGNQKSRRDLMLGITISDASDAARQLRFQLDDTLDAAADEPIFLELHFLAGAAGDSAALPDPSSVDALNAANGSGTEATPFNHLLSRKPSCITAFFGTLADLGCYCKHIVVGPKVGLHDSTGLALCRLLSIVGGMDSLQTVSIALDGDCRLTAMGRNRMVAELQRLPSAFQQEGGAGVASGVHLQWLESGQLPYATGTLSVIHELHSAPLLQRGAPLPRGESGAVSPHLAHASPPPSASEYHDVPCTITPERGGALGATTSTVSGFNGKPIQSTLKSNHQAAVPMIPPAPSVAPNQPTPSKEEFLAFHLNYLCSLEEERARSFVLCTGYALQFIAQAKKFVEGCETTTKQLHGRTSVVLKGGTNTFVEMFLDASVGAGASGDLFSVPASPSTKRKIKAPEKGTKPSGAPSTLLSKRRSCIDALDALEAIHRKVKRSGQILSTRTAVCLGAYEKLLQRLRIDEPLNLGVILEEDSRYAPTDGTLSALAKDLSKLPGSTPTLSLRQMALQGKLLLEESEGKMVDGDQPRKEDSKPGWVKLDGAFRAIQICVLKAVLEISALCDDALDATQAIVSPTVSHTVTVALRQRGRSGIPQFPGRRPTPSEGPVHKSVRVSGNRNSTGRGRMLSANNAPFALSGRYHQQQQAIRPYHGTFVPECTGQDEVEDEDEWRSPYQRQSHGASKSVAPYSPAGNHTAPGDGYRSVGGGGGADGYLSVSPGHASSAAAGSVFSPVTAPIEGIPKHTVSCNFSSPQWNYQHQERCQQLSDALAQYTEECQKELFMLTSPRPPQSASTGHSSLMSEKPTAHYHLHHPREAAFSTVAPTATTPPTLKWAYRDTATTPTLREALLEEEEEVDGDVVSLGPVVETPTGAGSSSTQPPRAVAVSPAVSLRDELWDAKELAYPSTVAAAKPVTTTATAVDSTAASRMASARPQQIIPAPESGSNRITETPTKVAASQPQMESRANLSSSGVVTSPSLRKVVTVGLAGALSGSLSSSPVPSRSTSSAIVPLQPPEEPYMPQPPNSVSSYSTSSASAHVTWRYRDPMEECFHGLGLDAPQQPIGGKDPQLELRRIYVQLRNQMEAKREDIARRVEVEVQELVAGKGVAASKGSTDGKENTVMHTQGRTIVTLPTLSSNGIARAPHHKATASSSSSSAPLQQVSHTEPTIRRVISPRKILVTVSPQESNMSVVGGEKAVQPARGSHATSQGQSPAQLSHYDDQEEDDELYCV